MKKSLVFNSLLKAYDELQTQTILLHAYNDATADGLDHSLIDLYFDNGSGGKYDVGYWPNNVQSGPQNDTFTVNGVTLTSDPFGNFLAGFAGQAYNNTPYQTPYSALGFVEAAGLLFDIIAWVDPSSGASKNVNDPLEKRACLMSMRGRNMLNSFFHPQFVQKRNLANKCGKINVYISLSKIYCRYQNYNA